MKASPNFDALCDFAYQRADNPYEAHALIEAAALEVGDAYVDGFREAVRQAARLVNQSGPDTIQKSALVREIRSLDPLGTKP